MDLGGIGNTESRELHGSTAPYEGIRGGSRARPPLSLPHQAVVFVTCLIWATVENTGLDIKLPL